MRFLRLQVDQLDAVTGHASNELREKSDKLNAGHNYELNNQMRWKLSASRYCASLSCHDVKWCRDFAVDKEAICGHKFIDEPPANDHTYSLIVLSVAELASMSSTRRTALNMNLGRPIEMVRGIYYLT